MNGSSIAKHAGLLSIGGFVAVLIGLAVYWFLMDISWVRSTALPSLVLIAGGLAVCGFAVYQQRSITTIASTSLASLLGMLFVFLIFGLTRLPAAAAAPQVGQNAPAFSISNQLGQKVALADLHKNGPALLVFYRGHW
jgi:hypothetical protein